MEQNIENNQKNDQEDHQLEDIDKIDNLQFSGDENIDTNELFGERLALLSFQVKSSIYLYEQQFFDHKFNKYLFNFKGISSIFILGALIHTFLFLLISSNPIEPSKTENFYANTSMVLLMLLFFGYIFLLKKQKISLSKEIFYKFLDLNHFFENTNNRFYFVQYLLKNKTDFSLSENNELFTSYIKQLKMLDKNKNIFLFSLLSLKFYDCDLLSFYQKLTQNVQLNTKNNKDLNNLFKNFDDSINKANKESLEKESSN